MPGTLYRVQEGLVEFLMGRGGWFLVAVLVGAVFLLPRGLLLEDSLMDAFDFSVKWSLGICGGSMFVYTMLNGADD